MIEIILLGIAGYVGLGVIVFVLTWFSFMFLMWGKRTWGQVLTYLLSPLLLVCGIVGWILDVFWNIIYATVIFQQMPDIYKGMRIHDVTLSHRLRQILRHDTSITPDMKRWRIADVLCKYFIEPHDCTHCGRNG